VNKEYLHGRKWQSYINRIRQMTIRRVAKIPIAEKANRLLRVQKLLDECMTWRLDKINYDKDGNELSKVMKRNIGAAAALLREAREEVEGPKPLIDQSQHYTIFKGMSDEQIFDECRKRGIPLPAAIARRS